METQGKRNMYQCLSCGFGITTRNRDEGVTPMFLRCRANGCGGQMASFLYQLPPVYPAATYEWYRPTPDATSRLEAGERDHVERGGLLLRKLKMGRPSGGRREP